MALGVVPTLPYPRFRPPRAVIAQKLFFEAIAKEIRQPLEDVLAVTELLQRLPLSPDAQGHVRTLSVAAPARLVARP